MRVLWITRESPYPALSGDLIYTSGMVQSLRQAGADVAVLGHERVAADCPRPGTIQWMTVACPRRSNVRSLLSPLPNDASRYDVPALKAALVSALRLEWDAVVLDHIGSGWAWREVLQARRNSEPRFSLVYVAQNDESATHMQVAAAATGCRRAVLRLDAAKAARLERSMVESADLVTTVSVADEVSLRRRHALGRSLVVSPGYAGDLNVERAMSSDLPRQVALVGSFHWIAKQMNLREVVGAVDGAFYRLGVELLVVGQGPQRLFESLRRKTKATTFLGEVGSVAEHLGGARLGLVAETIGGGFKVKVLDYVFNGVPVLAVAGSIAGLPPAERAGFLVAPTVESLGDCVAGVIDDIDMLNRVQRTAREQFRDRYDWRTRGESLLAAIRGLRATGTAPCDPSLPAT